MNTLRLVLVLGTIFVAATVLVWLLLKKDNPSPKNKKAGNVQQDAARAAEQDVEHIFNDEFREELRNRGRLHFEKIIGENAMFLQQDLRLTTSQLNDYMKQEITRTLQEEFAKYEESITDAKQLAVDSIAKTQEAIEQQRQILGAQLQKEVATEKTRLIGRFEENMADIVNHYVLAAIGNQIDLSDQLEYILSDLEDNKQAIIEDITHGA
ncbi:MAG TPA: hypothetical protein VK963_04345 [Candidatus Saccharimonadales bacterium]|nr:hypothetical protein [Candidatus Saccharimonadales bacterium]